MNDSTEQRVAVLEEQNRQQTRDLAKLETSVDHRLLLMQKDLSEIKDNMAKQRGFWAGVTFIASVIGFVMSQLWSHIRGLAQ